MSTRVYELAEELGLSSRQVIAALANLGAVAKSFSSAIEDDAADKLREAKSKGTLEELAARSAAASRPRATRTATAKPASAAAPRPAAPATPRATTAAQARASAAPAAAADGAPAGTVATPRRPAAAPARPRTAKPAAAPIEEIIAGPTRSEEQVLPKPGESGVREVKRPQRPAARPAAAPRPAAAAAGTSRPSAERVRPSAERGRPSAERRGPQRGGRGRPGEAEDDYGFRERKKRVADKAVVSELTVTRGITVADLSGKLGIPANEIIKKLFLLGTMYTMTQSLDDDAAELIAAEYGCTLTVVSPEDELEAEEEVVDDETTLAPRPPVITVMGHVDHGKTLLLDAIRETDVVSTEHGGITQHIGAYQVHKSDRAITFIDTPGHEAFTQMRARGAQVTDIAVLVVAADDGVKPQTLEALSHAKAAGVPIVVAVNKIDKEGSQPERVRQQLTEHELIPEEWGGETPFVDVSAKAKTNITELLDILLLVADIRELKANPTALAKGTIIEAHLDKGRGPVATVLVQRGTLRVGDPIVAGGAMARVRAMFDDRGERMTEAGPGTPAQVNGFDIVPMAGDDFRAFDDERKARQVAENRSQKLRVAERIARKRVSLKDAFSRAAETGQQLLLNVVLKADVQGSLEAVTDALEKLKVEDASVQVLHRAVGAIGEGDVSLAAASDAVVIGFNVRPSPEARNAAEASGVDIRTYQIIYKLVEEIEAALTGMLAPEYEEHILGRAEVREVFKIPRGVIAGSMVTEGTITRNAKVRLLREGVVVTTSTINSLRRFKDDAREVKEGFECGIGIENYLDIKVGDAIESFEERLVPR
jgi:translation initiation factor IF-2